MVSYPDHTLMIYPCLVLCGCLIHTLVLSNVELGDAVGPVQYIHHGKYLEYVCVVDPLFSSPTSLLFLALKFLF